MQTQLETELGITDYDAYLLTALDGLRVALNEANNFGQMPPDQVDQIIRDMNQSIRDLVRAIRQSDTYREWFTRKTYFDFVDQPIGTRFIGNGTHEMIFTPVDKQGLAGEPVKFTLTVANGTVTGTVVDYLRSEPRQVPPIQGSPDLEGYTVGLWDGINQVAQTTTDAAGGFAFKSVNPLDVNGSPMTYRLWGSQLRSEFITFPFSGLTVGPVDVRVESGNGVLKGVVTDEAGRPVEDAIVRVFYQDIHAYAALTNSAGEYEIRNIETSRYSSGGTLFWWDHNVRVSKPGYFSNMTSDVSFQNVFQFNTLKHDVSLTPDWGPVSMTTVVPVFDSNEINLYYNGVLQDPSSPIWNVTTDTSGNVHVEIDDPSPLNEPSVPEKHIALVFDAPDPNAGTSGIQTVYAFETPVAERPRLRVHPVTWPLPGSFQWSVDRVQLIQSPQVFVIRAVDVDEGQSQNTLTITVK